MNFATVIWGITQNPPSWSQNFSIDIDQRTKRHLPEVGQQFFFGEKASKALERASKEAGRAGKGERRRKKERTAFPHVCWYQGPDMKDEQDHSKNPTYISAFMSMWFFKKNNWILAFKFRFHITAITQILKTSWSLERDFKAPQLKINEIVTYDEPADRRTDRPTNQKPWI